MSALAFGTQLAGYRIEALVGRGGMGVVYRARELDLDRIVALKVIAPELVEDDAVRERFLREARAAAAIEHPHVIPVHAAGEADGLAYLAMRYINGDDLRARVRREGPLPFASAVTVIEAAAAGLDAIHRGGFVHRDIKPANLLLDGSGHLYVTDFGLAKEVFSHSGISSTGRWVGTLDYIAPEQIRGGRIDARADVYALGGVLHFALTGHVPFEREGDEAKLWAQLSEPPPRASRWRADVGPALDAVVARAMSKPPEARFPSAGDLARAARAAIAGTVPSEPERMVARGAAAPGGAATEPGLAPEASTITAKPPRVTRRPRRRWAAASLAVVAVAAGAALAARGIDDAPPDGGGAPAVAATPVPEFSVAGTTDDVGRRPSAIVYAAGDLWVVSSEDRKLTRIDAATGRKRAQQTTVGDGVVSVVTDGKTLWFARARAEQVIGVSVRTGRVVRRLRPGGKPLRLARDETGLWVLVAGPPPRLVRYDPRGARRLTSISLQHRISAMTSHAGVLWLVDRAGPTLLRLDPNRRKPTEVLRMPDVVPVLSAGDGFLWAVLREQDAVARIVPKTGNYVTLAAGHFPTHALVVGHRVFIASRNDSKVIVRDTQSTKPVVEELSVGLNPYELATDGRSVWVTALSENTVTRIARR